MSATARSSSGSEPPLRPLPSWSSGSTLRVATTNSSYASKFPDLDLTGLTRKEDIREAIELHEASTAEAAPKSGSVFE
jgi:hypothetical protein